MEQLPHQLIEGMILSAWALQTYRGYIFLRGEYVVAAERLRQAIREAEAAGYLGKNILAWRGACADPRKLYRSTNGRWHGFGGPACRA